MPSSTPRDLLIHARWVVPIEPRGAVLEDHSIVVQAGRIEAILPREQASAIPARQVLERPAHAVLPGFVNAHAHAAMTLLRGAAAGRPLEPWLRQVVWPLESRLVDADFVRDGTEQAIAEMLLGGTTCFADMYFFPEVVAQLASDLGMRAAVAVPVLDVPTVWAATIDEYLDKGLRLADEYRGHPLVHTFFALHSPALSTDATLARVRTLADQLDAPVMIHLLESADDAARERSRHGIDPVDRLERAGLVNNLLVAVHCVHLDEAGIGRFADVGANVVHCPTSNLKLASGIAPVAAMRAAGLNVALGSDGSASNDRLDMLSEARLAALLAAGATGDAAAVGAADALEMATLAGARAMGLDAGIGSLVPGKWADLCCVDLGKVSVQPVIDVFESLLHSASRADVSDVWVAGRQLVEDGTLLRIDTASLRARTNRWQSRVLAARNSLPGN